MRHVYQDQTIGGADILNSLADVNIGNPEDGQMLVYDASTQRWRNVTQKSLNDLAEVTDLTDIIATGTTNATGATIPKGTYFYLNDDLCQAKADIASGATFTENTNYEEVTAGGLNALNSNITTINNKIAFESSGTSTSALSYTKMRHVVFVSLYGATSSTSLSSLPAPSNGCYVKCPCDSNGVSIGYIQYYQGQWQNAIQSGKSAYNSFCYISET